MTTDEAYELVAAELSRDNPKPGLMAKSIAEADGNEQRVKSLYIRYRARQLMESAAAAHNILSKNRPEPVNDNIISRETWMGRQNPVGILLALAWTLLILALCYVVYIAFA